MAKLLAGPGPVLASLAAQYETASVSRREWTGAGFMTDVQIAPGTLPLFDLLNLHISDVVAEIGGLHDGAGFALHIKNGVLDCLEGFSYDEPWPASIGTFGSGIPATGGGRPLSLQSTRP